MLLLLPDLRDKISKNAVREVEENRTPAQSALEFMILWLGLASEEPKHSDFQRVLGDDPAAWYLATQCLPGASWQAPEFREKPAKGTLAHFESVFAGDVIVRPAAGLARLHRLPKLTRPPAGEQPEAASLTPFPFANRKRRGSSRDQQSVIRGRDPMTDH